MDSKKHLTPDVSVETPEVKTNQIDCRIVSCFVNRSFRFRLRTVSTTLVDRGSILFSHFFTLMIFLTLLSRSLI